MGFRTQRDVDRLSLPPGKGEHFVADDLCAGLYVRLQGVTKSWVVRYPAPGRGRRKMKLGDVAGIALGDARKQAAPIIAGARNGADPLNERAQRARRTADTLGALVEIYIGKYAERHQRPRTLVETKRALRVHLAPLHSQPLHAVTRRDVAARLLALIDSSGPIMANRTRAALSHCYAWAMQQGLVDANPVVGTARPAPEVKRDRALSAEELRAVWHACGDDTHGRIVKLLILTGQRCREIGDMSWQEIDRDRALFTLPASRSKNGRANEIPLASAALALLPAPKADGLVFGRASSKAGFSGWTKAKRRLDKACGVKAWTLHDLRRTAVTGMAEIGVAPHVIEAIVNHVSGFKGGVAGVYNHAKYSQEKRGGLARWAAYVEALGSGQRGDNVVELARAGR